MSALTDKATVARAAVKKAGGLVTSVDMAERWGCSPQYAHRVTRRPDFPTPLLKAGRVQVWLRAEVDAYRKAHQT